MQSVGISSSVHQTSGEFINDDDLSVLDYVVYVALHYCIGAESLVYVMCKHHVLSIGIVIQIEILFDLLDTVLCKCGVPCLLVDDNVLRDDIKVFLAVLLCDNEI